MTSHLKLASRPGGWPEDAPPRSTVFGLVPEGFSGETFEDLGSYFRRLAHRHGLLPWTLAYHAIAPLICGRDSVTNGHVAEECYGLAISGLTETAERWASALNALTAREDLQLRTLLPVRTVLPRYKLVARVERFCPACFADDERSNRPKYNRLLWMIDCVIACPIHGLILEPIPQEKGRCNKAFWLPGISRVNGESLANYGAGEALPHEVRIAWLIAELLDESFQCPEDFNHAPAITTFLDHASVTLFNGRAANFAAHLGVSKGELHGWMTGKVRPSLHRVVLIAYCCDCNVTDVLLGRKAKLHLRERPPVGDNRLVTRNHMGASKPVSALVAELDYLVELRTVKTEREGAEALDISVRYLRKIAPAVAAHLVALGKQHKRDVAAANMSAKSKEYLRSHRSFTTAGDYPAWRKVVADVRKRTGITFAFRELCRIRKAARESTMAEKRIENHGGKGAA
ncbi:hypothetical protein QF001_001772 [Paraburkholderia youngii]|uniref:TniQ family protein n=1 Tax=Paraburkholderia youngii TaxID=2782701 RepID=UPI003D1FB963